MKKNNVCIVGLGYVGLTLSLYLAKKSSMDMTLIQELLRIYQIVKQMLLKKTYKII